MDIVTYALCRKQLQEALAGVIKNNTDAIAILNGDANTNGSVTKQVNDAIAALVDGAPEALDTLKELADWVSNQSIEILKIKSLFPEKQAENQTAVDAITSMKARSALKLTANQEITEDLVIDKSCYIDANGSTFSGTVTVPADIDVIIENANFANPVVVA